MKTWLHEKPAKSDQSFGLIGGAIFRRCVGSSLDSLCNLDVRGPGDFAWGQVEIEMNIMA